VERDEKDSTEETNGLNVESDDQEKIKYQAEGKLVSFCEQILKAELVCWNMVRLSPVASRPSPPPPCNPSLLIVNGGNGSPPPRDPSLLLASPHPHEPVEDAVARRDAWRRANVPQADSGFETSSSSGSHRPLARIHGDPRASGGMKKSSSPSIFRPYDFPNLKDAR
jgi:hypothetical protein